jgi:hypothetical protein
MKAYMLIEKNCSGEEGPEALGEWLLVIQDMGLRIKYNPWIKTPENPYGMDSLDVYSEEGREEIFSDDDQDKYFMQEVELDAQQVEKFQQLIAVWQAGTAEAFNMMRKAYQHYAC